MKTMSDYTVYCTEEQTKRSFRLGAQMDFAPHQFYKSVFIEENEGWCDIPTINQMIAWLQQEKGLEINIYKYNNVFDAIDAALDYLEKGK